MWWEGLNQDPWDALLSPRCSGFSFVMSQNHLGDPGKIIFSPMVNNPFLEKKKKEKGKEIDFQIPKILWPGFFLYNVDSTEHWSQGEGGQINDSMSKIYWEGCIQSPIPSRGYEKSWDFGCSWKIIQRLRKTNSICPFSFVDPSFNIYIGVLIGCEYQSGN